MKTSLITMAIGLLLLLMPSCSTDPDVRRGQATGAVVGGIAGGLIDDDWEGAAVGAAVGGLTGGAIARGY
jgi:hypothetical protein